jgi:hypothetical protein
LLSEGNDVERPSVSTLLATWAAIPLLSCASPQNAPWSKTVLYDARGDEWRLKLFSDRIEFFQKLGPLKWDWYGEVPLRSQTESGVRLEGELTHTYVITGLVEENRMTYRIEIEPVPCRGRSGRIWETTVTIHFSPEVRDKGCGGPLPPPSPPPA